MMNRVETWCDRNDPSLKWDAVCAHDKSLLLAIIFRLPRGRGLPARTAVSGFAMSAAHGDMTR